jgi:hypothetical protein
MWVCWLLPYPKLLKTFMLASIYWPLFSLRAAYQYVFLVCVATYCNSLSFVRRLWMLTDALHFKTSMQSCIIDQRLRVFETSMFAGSAICKTSFSSSNLWQAFSAERVTLTLNRLIRTDPTK